MFPITFHLTRLFKIWQAIKTHIHIWPFGEATVTTGFPRVYKNATSNTSRTMYERESKVYGSRGRESILKHTLLMSHSLLLDKHVIMPLKVSYGGACGLSQLSIRILVLTQDMILGSWDQAPRRASHSVESSWDSLHPPVSSPLCPSPRSLMCTL